MIDSASDAGDLRQVLNARLALREFANAYPLTAQFFNVSYRCPCECCPPLQLPGDLFPVHRWYLTTQRLAEPADYEAYRRFHIRAAANYSEVCDELHAAPIPDRFKIQGPSAGTVAAAHHLLPPRAHQPPPAGARVANAKPDRPTLTGSDGLSYPVVNSSAFTTTTEAGPSATTPLHGHRQPCGSGKPNKRSADDGDDVDPEALAAYRDRHGARRRSRERSPSPRSRARAVAPKRDEPYLGNKVSSSAYPRRSDNRRSR